MTVEIANTPAPLAKFDFRTQQIRERVAPENAAIYDRIVEKIDAKRVADLQLEWSDAVHDNPLSGFAKYLDLAFWIAEKIERLRKLGINESQKLRILDLGCGAGHFLAVCDAMGHRAVGFDAPMQICSQIAMILEVERHEKLINSREPLGADWGKFDLITAFAVKFDSKGRNQKGWEYWSIDDWQFFLDDIIINHLEMSGRIHLQLNKQLINGVRVTADEVFDYFESRGASVNRKRGTADISAEKLLS